MSNTRARERLLKYLDGLVKQGMCRSRVGRYRKYGSIREAIAHATTADAAWVLCDAKRVYHGAALEARVVDSFYASDLLLDTRRVHDRAALEARVTDPRDACYLLKFGRTFANRKRLERIAGRKP